MKHSAAELPTFKGHGAGDAADFSVEPARVIWTMASQNKKSVHKSVRDGSVTHEKFCIGCRTTGADVIVW